MALVATPASAEVGTPVVISGSGFTAAGVVNFQVLAEAEQGVEVDFSQTCAGGIPPGFTVIPGGPGHFIVNVVDVTTPANNTSLRVTVFES